MKATILSTAALIGALLLPSLAFATTVVDGCEVEDMGGYLNKADPTCRFENTKARQTGTAVTIVATGDPSMPFEQVTSEGNKD